MESLPKVLACAGSGLAGGILSGLFGVGGGIVMVPLLGLAVGLDQHRAQGLTLAAMLLPNGLPAVLHYRRRGIPVHGKLVGSMLVGFLPGVVAGAWTANWIPEPPLRWGFAAFLLMVATQTLIGSFRPAPDRVESPRREDSVGFALFTGLAGGVSAGLLGIGGGLVIIPLLVWRYRMPQQEAQVQSLVLLLLPLGLPGVLVYAAAQGGLPWLLLASVAGGFMLGAYLGARLGTALRGPMLQRGFAAMMVLTAALLIRKG